MDAQTAAPLSAQSLSIARHAGPILAPLEHADADANVVKDPLRYKTVMCQNWLARGSCPYGHKCQFAHGEDEMRVKPNKRRGRAGTESKAGRRAKAGATPAASQKRTATRAGANRLEPPRTPVLRPTPHGDFLPPPLALPKPLLSQSWESSSAQASQPVAAATAPLPPTRPQQSPCPSEMLELSKAALEQSILLSQAVVSLAAPTSYMPMAPPQHPMAHLRSPMPPLPHGVGCSVPALPPPPSPLQTLMRHEQHIAAHYVAAPYRDITGPARSSGELSAAPTTFGSLDSTYEGGAFSEKSGYLDDVDTFDPSMFDASPFDSPLDSPLDFAMGLEALRHAGPRQQPLKPMAPPLPRCPHLPGQAPDPESIARSLSFLWSDEQAALAVRHWGTSKRAEACSDPMRPVDLPSRPPAAAAPGPANRNLAPNSDAERLRSSYVSALEELDFSRGSEHVACQLNFLFSEGSRSARASATTR
mmetsp:Transcript_23995/g.67470  ORF Transcript_23995/g.67470 Transcript_23995/m.67470 type:complete len:475 (-) Transcript_23995:960-2384(-)